jgi:hypothetical protein
MPVTLAFQRMSDVSGAGPDENREKEESPMNWGHSYWSRLELTEVVLPLVCALTRFEFDCKVKTAETVETSSSAKINVTLILICVTLAPKDGCLGFHFTINFAEIPKFQ